MLKRGEVLVAIMNNPADFEILCTQHWYRIPVRSVSKWLQRRWPPSWLALYQTKVFGDEAYSIRYYGKVAEIRTVYRSELFPHEPRGPKSNERYYQLFIKNLQCLPKPILSRRWRRVVFIPTTWQKFSTAVEINDLYDDSVLEDKLWAEFKRNKIPAERQVFVTAQMKHYALDFAVYCNKGKLNVEADGDTWHATPARAKSDNMRDNDLKTSGWHILRFGSSQIQEEAASYCVPTVTKVINNLDGPAEERIIPRKIALDGEDEQLSLFDDL